ncbi:SURF1 family protein [Alteromonas sp. 1_MG-2023]|uniref:SURF1 family protein n=1 Tax=Alteromonas sp. 1_MG-2023 TaxID=3062669 RepID=UPI0026E382C7|nr:SURF1 family protein [Alteromonas sp. 1_MG-2023]MDO6566834.1 SURF1 family protein [Alteromonas sp. 1_MG-2023]
MNQVRASKLIAIVITSLCVMAMCSLGFWQLDRMAQKQQRIASITEKQGKESVSLIDALSMKEPEDRVVTFEGTPNGDKVLLLDNQIHEQRVGYDVLAPVQTNAGWVLVNYGWLPAPDLSRSLPAVKISHHSQQFEGVVSQPSHNPLVKETLTSASRFPARIQQISISTASELLSLNLLPYVVVLTAKNDLFVRRYNSVVMPPEKHLGYAIQWFGLAIAAALIGGFAIMKKGRQYE